MRREETQHYPAIRVGEVAHECFECVERRVAVPFDDLADMLEQQSSRDTLSSDFLLNQLYALIRAPFEIVCDYCEDYDKVVGGSLLSKQMKASRAA